MLIDNIKKAARITHNALDEEINRLIGWAHAEMKRAGVPSAIVDSDGNSLIDECTMQGVLAHISTDEKIREKAENAFTYQLDNLRKHVWPEPNPDPESEQDAVQDQENGDEGGT